MQTSNSKINIPSLGLGTWKAAPGEVARAVYAAIEIGYRHIDCASIYGNEKEIGEAIERCINEGIVKREDLWITSKLWNEYHAPEDVRPAIESTLSDLKIDYLDLYLMHWPVALKKGAARPFTGDDFISLSELPIIDTWRAMEQLVDDGHARNIGVSNFSIQKLIELSPDARHPIAANQIEAHPYLQQPRLLKYCEENGICVTAYSPLGSLDRPSGFKKENEPILFEDQTLKEITANKNTSIAQVILAWSVQRGTNVIPKSVNPVRMKENIDSLSLKLSDEDMKLIGSLDKNRRYIDGKVWAAKGSPYTVREIWGE